MNKAECEFNTREEIVELLEWKKDGGDLQFLSDSGGWCHSGNVIPSFHHFKYRKKREPIAHIWRNRYIKGMEGTFLTESAAKWNAKCDCLGQVEYKPVVSC